MAIPQGGVAQGALDELAERGAEEGVDLAPGLELVETRLRELVRADLALVEETSRYLIDAGGKRFRPMLVLLAGLHGGVEPTARDLVDAGAIVELVHLSTLYHDDVIDAADVRRGADAAHVKWSNTTAILTGDFLLARASELSAELGVEVTKVMARTIADLCTGQIREVQGSASGQDHGMPTVAADTAHYRAVLGEKTASLIASSCRLGALLSGQPREAVEVLTTYGWHLGLSFQLADDVLDIVGDEEEAGKSPGTDLREGVKTMPVLLALEDDPTGELARLVDVAAAEPDEDDGPTAAEVDEALARALRHLRGSPAMERARDEARLEARRAVMALTELPEFTATAEGADSDLVTGRGLLALADYAVDRLV
ncbi:polyprenyl synthetase family protein [Egibacter rhizosphaerae]|uniref:Polyprenyl synthetase family protein n=1 Tax=Egibacter rhizosphaerae TaxID=1670831 RepID=A0A411YGU9_9ACTN|nr:polyprenyl synthetase family protein [Egibacter rhizosphaerae]QBI20371.1 polyprenyl synthetase family protein [Egibacter rhizosphaerae]